MPYKAASLPEELLKIIRAKGTEPPFSSIYHRSNQPGTFLCRQCGLALFRADSQFDVGCGWPSFDVEIPDTVLKQPDADGRRTEILCQRCLAHLGHIFHGEQLTQRNTRYCVNGASLDFVTATDAHDTEEIIVAGGCFWGVEYYLKKLPGIVKTEVGYTGGTTQNPSYDEVCQHQTGHVEAIRIVFDPQKISLTAVLKYFLEIHDPTQANGQGPDIGPQYLSRIFYYDSAQETIAQQLLLELAKDLPNIATQVLPATPFWPAENYHQDYYGKTHKSPYCHQYTKRFK